MILSVPIKQLFMKNLVKTWKLLIEWHTWFLVTFAGPQAMLNITGTSEKLYNSFHSNWIYSLILSEKTIVMEILQRQINSEVKQ